MDDAVAAAHQPLLSPANGHHHSTTAAADASPATSDGKSFLVNGMPSGANGHQLRFSASAEFPGLVRSLRAFHQSGGPRPLHWRLSQLRSLRAMLHEHRAEMVDCIRAQFGHAGLLEAAEIGLVEKHLDYAIYHLAQWMQPESAEFDLMMLPGKMYYAYEPYGVVLVMSPWNYPFQLALLPIIGALAAGNVVVLKPSELAAHSAVWLEKWIPQYLDQRAVRVVQGGVEETTALLEQRFDMIFFTGSSNVGRIVLQAAAKHLTPTILELGGKCPTYLAPDFDIALAARRLVTTKFTWNMGQTCVSPDYILLQKQTLDKFISEVKDTLLQFYGKDPESSKDLYRMINLRNMRRLTAMLNDDTIQVIAGGKWNEDRLWIEPTVVLAKAESKCMQDELFGPILPIVVVANDDEAINFINSRSKPLGSYLFTYNKKLQKRFEQETSSGALVLNDCGIQTQSLTLAFGGVGESGMGQYHGKDSFKAFSHRKPVVRKIGKNDKFFRYPPIDDRKLKRVERLPALYALKMKRCWSFFLFLVFAAIVAAAVYFGVMYFMEMDDD